MRRGLPAALVAAVLLLTACSVTPENSAPQPTAQPIERTGRLPDIRLPSIGGGPAVELGSLRGPMVITLWASWCDPCEEELPIIADFARGNDDVTVLGVDYQDEDKAKALRMMRAAKVGFPVVYDFDGEITRAIGLPKMLMIDAAGEVVFNEYVPITSRKQLAGLVDEHLGVEAS